MEPYYYVSFTAMSLHACIFLYYIWLARIFPVRLGDRQIYYTTAILPLIPLTLNGLNVVNYLWNDRPIDAATLNLFFIEWCFTNPLLITNLARVVNIRLIEQLGLTVLAISVNVLGYLSHITHVYEAKLALFSVAALLFTGLCGFLCYHYKTQHRVQPAVSIIDTNKMKIYRACIISILCTWPVYPIVYIIYTTGNLTHEGCAIAFTCADLVSKATFSSLLIGYQEALYWRKGFAAYIVRKAARIVPIITIDQTTTVVCDTLSNDVLATIVYDEPQSLQPSSLELVTSSA